MLSLPQSTVNQDYDFIEVVKVMKPWLACGNFLGYLFYFSMDNNSGITLYQSTQTW